MFSDGSIASDSLKALHFDLLTGLMRELPYELVEANSFALNRIPTLAGLASLRRAKCVPLICLSSCFDRVSQPTIQRDSWAQVRVSALDNRARNSRLQRL